MYERFVFDETLQSTVNLFFARTVVLIIDQIGARGVASEASRGLSVLVRMIS